MVNIKYYLNEKAKAKINEFGENAYPLAVRVNIGRERAGYYFKSISGNDVLMTPESFDHSFLDGRPRSTSLNEELRIFEKEELLKRQIDNLTGYPLKGRIELFKDKSQNMSIAFDKLLLEVLNEIKCISFVHEPEYVSLKEGSEGETPFFSKKIFPQNFQNKNFPIDLNVQIILTSDYSLKDHFEAALALNFFFNRNYNSKKFDFGTAYGWETGDLKHFEDYIARSSLGEIETYFRYPNHIKYGGASVLFYHKLGFRCDPSKWKTYSEILSDSWSPPNFYRKMV